jgi:S-methylmethionine-dependent homocysteine/selenocysteine methylase
VVLGDCAVETRLRFESPFPIDEQLGLLSLLGDPSGSAAISAVLAGYAGTAIELGLPIVLDAPTWWARPDRLAARGLRGRAADRLVRDAVALAVRVRDRYDNAYVSAALGPSTDGYRPGSVDTKAATVFHHQQAERLATTDADVLLAGTFSTLADLQLAARALEATGKPYALGPTVNAEGRMPDGTPLHQAIDHIESRLARPPGWWSLCCVHPSVALRAMEALADADPDARRRVTQIKGNGSTLDARQRDAADHVLSDDVESWAIAAIGLQREHAVTVIGGCCGTDHRHLLAVATRITKPTP